MSQTNSIIYVDNLNSGYGNSHILFGVDFEAKENEITIIVGPNGSGKSTLLKSIFGLCDVYSGNISYDDKIITGLAPHEVARKKIAYLPQINNVFVNLTIKENLTMASYTLDSSTQSQRLPEIFETFPILKKYETSKANILSGGERQMLAMAMAL
ncbi:MAG TPA: ATP-binding cassette domain-containing protein, partial [Nitrosopumilus sp.]|nr:ATP-binding cassette domain-containing protein [Nitrosopumilus sp.]